MRNRHLRIRPNHNFGRMMDEFLVPPHHKSTAPHQPKVNVAERDNVYDIAVAVPGYAKENFSIKVEKDHLIISANIEAKQEKKEQYTRKEFDVCSFERSFHLADTLDSEQISANYANGILTVTIAKKVVIDTTKQIEIS